MSTLQNATFPYFRAFDPNGAPLTGGKVFTYAAGTTTPLATYSDAAGTIPLSNPVILDSTGEARIFLGQSAYKIILQDQFGVQQWSADNVWQPGYDTFVTLNPTGNQTITMPAGTALTINNLVSPKAFPYSVANPPYNAVGDNATNNTGAFSAAESASANDFFLPYGQFRMNQTQLGKMYKGPGSIVYGNNRGRSGYSSVEENMVITGLGGANVFRDYGISSLCWIGDSITSGYFVNYNQSYVYRLQKMMNDHAGGVGQSDFRSGSSFEFWTTTGTVTNGTAGPQAKSLILAVGATISFTAQNVDVLRIFYQRASGAGTLTLTAGGPTIGAPLNCSGAAGNDIMGQIFISGRPSVQNFTITCTVASVEITGFTGLAYTSQGRTPVILTRFSQGGYSTANYTSAPVLTSILAQVPYYATGFFRAIIALGTNDIFNPATAISSAAFGANLETIIAGLTVFCVPILTVPLRTTGATYAPVLEPFDNYRDVIYQKARKYSLQVVDFSELDLAAAGAYYTDGLHPNDYGHAMMANKVWQELGLSQLALAPTSYPITLAAGNTPVLGAYAPCVAWERDGFVHLSGSLSFASTSAAGFVVGSVPADIAPSYKKVGSVATSSGAAGMYVQQDGALAIQTFTAAATTISLDGFVYKLREP